MPIPNPDSASTITVPRITRNHVNDLPVELLSQILALVVFSSKRVNFQFHLSKVCRYWRQIIFGNPVFWSIISFNWNGRDRTEYMEQFVHNSGSTELVVFGPGVEDSNNNSSAQTHFHNFLRREYKRIKALSLRGFDHRVEGLPNTVFENLQALSMSIKSFPLDMLAGAQNLQVFKLTAHRQLPNIIPYLPLHLKKISLRLLSDEGVFQIFTLFKRLEYLSFFFMEECEYYEITNRNRFSKQSLLNLKTFKSNDARLIMDTLHAPALQHLEITAPSENEIEDVLDAIDLSMFTHLYLGFIPKMDMKDLELTLNMDMDDNPIDGCIWASVGPSTVTHQDSFFCPDDTWVSWFSSSQLPELDNQTFVGPSTVAHQDSSLCLDDNHSTTWPSSWSVFPQLPESDDQVEPLVHIHTLSGYPVDDNNIHLSCKLVSRMPMLDTFVLCLPGEPDPEPRNSDPEWYDFHKPHIPKLFHEIAQSSHKLRNLIIRAGNADEESYSILSECFNQEYWTRDSCPLLEKITYYVHMSDVDSHVPWELWIKFLTGRKSIGRPLKHLHLINYADLDYPDPSDEILSKIKGLLSDTEITVTCRHYGCGAFDLCNVRDDGWSPSEYRLIPNCGFLEKYLQEDNITRRI